MNISKYCVFWDCMQPNFKIFLQIKVRILADLLWKNYQNSA